MINCVTIYSPFLQYVTSFYAFISLIWTTQYFNTGEFELVVEYSDEYMTALAKGNFIVKDNTNQIAVIERVRYEFTADEGGKIIASGRMAISLLDRRLMYNISGYHPTIQVYSHPVGETVEDAARSAVLRTAIEVEHGGSARKIANLELGTYNHLAGNAVKRISTYRNLYNAVTSMLATKNLAHKIIYNPVTSKLEYEVYKGTDRSSAMVFSRGRENLLSFSYETDTTDWKNLIVIGGEGEGLQRFATSVSTNSYQSGTERREVFYDAQSAREDNTSAADYAALLRNEAKQECRDMSKIVSVAAKIDLVNSGLQFGVDYNVGDIILVSDIIDFKPRITTVIESQSADGYNVDVEFNEDKPEEADE